MDGNGRDRPTAASAIKVHRLFFFFFFLFLDLYSDSAASADASGPAISTALLFEKSYAISLFRKTFFFRF